MSREKRFHRYIKRYSAANLAIISRLGNHALNILRALTLPAGRQQLFSAYLLHIFRFVYIFALNISLIMHFRYE